MEGEGKIRKVHQGFGECLLGINQYRIVGLEDCQALAKGHLQKQENHFPTP